MTNKLALTGGGTGQQNVFVVVAGRKGSGKSALTREILSHSDRLFLFDTMGEHHWVPQRFDDLAEAQAFLWDHAQHQQDFCAAFVSESAQAKALENDFTEICIAIYESGNVTYGVEEMPMLSAPQWVPEAFDRIVRLGRHRGINLLYTAQRLSECPRRLTAATDIFILFRHTEPRDLDAIAERCGPEVAAAVTVLGDHEFIVFDVRSQMMLDVSPEWYALVLRPGLAYTPAVDRRHGKMLWSLSDAE